MYIKISGVFVKLSYLLPLLIICLGCSFMGRSLALLYRANSSVTATFLLIAYIGGTYALSFGLGGLIAAFVSLALTFSINGLGTGVAAVVAAGLIMWLGFYDAKSIGAEKDQDLTPKEWAIALATVAIAGALVMAIMQAVSGIVTGILTGLIAGSIAVFGIQLKYTDTGVARPSRLLLVGSISSLFLGVVLGFFTYAPPILN